jgi:hypothetical protein
MGVSTTTDAGPRSIYATSIVSSGTGATAAAIYTASTGAAVELMADVGTVFGPYAYVAFTNTTLYLNCKNITGLR